MSASAASFACECGKVAFRADGPTLGTAVCYCDDCQEAARQIEARGDGPTVADPDGGTALSLWRKDKVTNLQGGELVVEHRLNSKTTTKRLVTSCCNSAMFIDFDRGPFWISVLHDRIAEPRPPIEFRHMTKYRNSALPYPDDAPTYPTFPKMFVGRLMWNWARKLVGR